MQTLTPPTINYLLENGEIGLPGRYADSPLVERVWHCHSDNGGSFISEAKSNWEIVVSKYPHETVVTIHGPETLATPADAPSNAEFIGIIFKAGVFMPKFPVSSVMDRHDLNLPQAGSNSFWLESSAWELPTFQNAESFVNRLVREGLLVHDPLVEVVLREQPALLSRRTIQRRFLRATGLTYNKMYQIQRARYATALLEQGVPILDTVEQAGYTDQSHLTRALRHFMGQTPAQIFTLQR
jgi:hypothetical protein